MPPRMEPEDAKSVWGGEEEDDEDATLVSTHHLVQPPNARAPSPSPGPFHPSRRPRKEPPTTPRWGALAVMALALLAVEALILLGVTDLRGLWGGGSDGDGSTAAAGSGSCQADHAAATEEGPFAGLRQWVGEQAEAGALLARYKAVVDEFEGHLEERERAGGGAKARGWTLLSARSVLCLALMVWGVMPAQSRSLRAHHGLDGFSPTVLPPPVFPLYILTARTGGCASRCGGPTRAARARARRC